MSAKRPLLLGVWVIPTLLWIVLGQATARGGWSAQSGELIVMISGRIGQSPTFGAGIIIGREKDRLYIATANHVVRQGGVAATDLQIRLKVLPARSLKAKLLPQVNRELDLAVLSVENLGRSGVDVCALSLDRLSEPGVAKRGAAVYPMGNPDGRAWDTPVQPDAITDVTGDTIVFQSALIARGHSGGGLFDAHAQLIGMIEADEPPYGRALGISKILEVFKGWNYPVQLQVPAPDGFPQLLYAVKQRDLDGLRRLLRETCTDVNAKTELPSFAQPWTALQEAVVQGRWDGARQISLAMVKLLIDAGAQVNRPDVRADSPLYLAARSGNAEVVRLLIAHGATVNEKVNGPCFFCPTTPLHAAAEGGALEAVQILLANGAEPNVVGYKNRNSPFYAIDRREPPKATREQILQVLLKAGVNVNWKDSNGDTPLMVAVERNEAGTVRALLEAGAEVDIRNRNEDSPIRRITIPTDKYEATSPSEIAALLVKFSSKIESEDGSRLLNKCAEEGWAEVADLLVKRGVGVNGTAKDADPPLQVAIEHGHTEVVRVLLSSGADPELVGVLGYSRDATPLQHVLRHQTMNPTVRLEIVELLLSKGAKVNVNPSDLRGEPLFLALFEQIKPDLKAAELLIAYGADVNATSGSSGVSLLWMARDQHLREVVDFLLKAGALPKLP